MTTQEFSNEFDVLYNNIMSNQAPGLNEYEKSVFLTKAQNEILKNYFNPKGNKYEEGFDGSAKRQIDFSNLTKSVTLSTITETGYNKIDSRSTLFDFPEDVLVVINENFFIKENSKSIPLVVIPIAYDEYMRLMSKPYKYPLKYQAWRLLNMGESNKVVELISSKTLIGGTYNIRYIKTPCPIILTSLDDNYSNLSIEGISGETQCELDPILHPEILQRAVELAKAAYLGDLNSSIELGKRSE